jgi:toxin ParE1/3/4
MSYTVNYSEKARLDLQNIYEYIAYELLVPDTAARQTNRI